MSLSEFFDGSIPQAVYICIQIPVFDDVPPTAIFEPWMFGNGTSIPVAFTAYDAYCKCVDAHGIDASGKKWLFYADVHRADGSLHDVFSKYAMKRVLSMRLYGVTTFHRRFNVALQDIAHRSWPQE